MKIPHENIKIWRLTIIISIRAVNQIPHWKKMSYEIHTKKFTDLNQIIKTEDKSSFKQDSSKHGYEVSCVKKHEWNFNTGIQSHLCSKLVR